MESLHSNFPFGTGYSNVPYGTGLYHNFQRIPQLGKPIWFQASCSQGVAANSSYPDYLIEGNSNSLATNILSFLQW